MRGAARTAAALALAALAVAPGCGTPEQAAVECRPGSRLALVAQSVSEAAYLPCVVELPAGWTVSSFDVHDGDTRFELTSDRAEHVVPVTFSRSCDIGTASPRGPRAEGVRSYQLLESVSPRYAGRLIDVFAGGCVTTAFDFARGPHIGLLDELEQAVGLYPRRQLAQELRRDMGVTLDP